MESSRNNYFVVYSEDDSICWQVVNFIQGNKRKYFFCLISDKKELTSENLIQAIDMFCGMGGSSRGARDAGIRIVAGFDMWELAGEVFQDNFSEAKFFQESSKTLTPVR